MAQNYVEIRVKALDTAKPELDDLKLQLDEIGRKVESAKVDVDDGDASVKLLRLNAKLADINAKVANPRIKVAGAARAEADLLALNLELDKLNAKSDELKAKADASGPGGLLGRLFSGIGGGGGGGGGGVAGDAGAGGGLLTNPYVLGGIAAGVTALLPELAGLVSGFSAAGAGAVAFYALAHPTISNLTQDTQNMLAANDKLQQAQNKYAADPTKANATALQTARDNLKAVQLSMSQDAGGAAAGIVKLRAEYGKLTTAFQPDVFKVFNAGLRVANNLLPAVMPFAKTFADVLDRLLGQLGKFTSSKGFTDWLKQFHGLEGPALDAIGKGFGQVAIQVGKLLTVMSSKDVVNAINIAFSVLSGTIDGLRHVVEAIMRAWDVTSKTMARDAREVATAFDALRHDIANWGHNMASYFDESRANVARWAQDVQRWADSVVRWFQAIPGKVLNALTGMIGSLYSMGVQAIQALLRGMGSMVGGAISTVRGWGHDILNALGSPFGIHFSEPSEATQVIKAGQRVAEGLGAGMLLGRGGVAAAARQLGGSASFAGGGAAGGGQVMIQIQPGAGGSGLEAQFWAWLKQGVRAQGGDPRMFNKKVAFQ